MENKIEVIQSPLSDEEISEESIRVLSQNGRIKRTDLNEMIPAVTWDAFDRGFVRGAKWALSRQGERWISVEDRLPEDKFAKVYLVRHNETIEALWDGSFYNISVGGSYRIKNATHWMYRIEPTPPNKEV